MGMSLGPTHHPQDYDTDFDPDAYLQHYFGKESIEDGTRVSLFALPVFAQIMIQTMRVGVLYFLIDEYSRASLVQRFLYYVEKNLETYYIEIINNNNFILFYYNQVDYLFILTITNRHYSPLADCISMIIRGTAASHSYISQLGSSNILSSNLLLSWECSSSAVDIMVSIFTLESACQTYSQYCSSVKNMVIKNSFYEYYEAPSFGWSRYIYIYI
uniref:Uncharacterized protein n=1 Tax=Heterorhabditis bacteriophora TaxID=37862 RepID=A0A1I7W5Y6_HETBA